MYYITSMSEDNIYLYSAFNVEKFGDDLESAEWESPVGDENPPDDLPEDWNFTVVHKPIDTELVLKLGEAGHLLQQRRQVVEKTDRFLHGTAGFLIKTGLCGLTVAPSLVLGLPFLVVGASIHYANRAIARKAYRQFDKAKEALVTCNDADKCKDDKEKAMDALYRTARHIRYWEKTRSVAGTLVKFGLGEAATLFAASWSFLEAKKEFNNQPHLHVSRVFYDALNIVHDNLHLQTPKPKS